ncbi:hypothetical protein GCM10018966_006530 [Streptomyces yanii]
MVGQAIASRHRPGCRAAHPHLVRHTRPGREHLCGNADIKRLRAIEDEDGDATQAGRGHGKQGTRARMTTDDVAAANLRGLELRETACQGVRNRPNDRS